MTLSDNPAAILPWLARCEMMRKKMNVGQIYVWAENVGAPARVQRLLKSSIGAGQTGNEEWGGAATGDWRATITAFMDSLRSRSVYFRLLDGGFTRVPMRKRIGLVTAGATGWIVGEGKPVPLSRLSLANQLLSPHRAAALMVTTEDLVRDVSAAGQALFARELRGACSDAVDAKFFELIIDTSTDGTEIIASAGTDEDAIRIDTRAALMAVNSVGNAALFWCMSPDVAKAASVFTQIFPAMSAMGGEMLNLPALISSTLEAGTLLLIDASGIAADADTIELRASSQADIEMADNPTMDATAGTATAASVSMFMTDSITLMATTLFAAERLRDNAIVKITGVDWGG